MRSDLTRRLEAINTAVCQVRELIELSTLPMKDELLSRALTTQAHVKSLRAAVTESVSKSKAGAAA